MSLAISFVQDRDETSIFLFRSCVHNSVRRYVPSEKKAQPHGAL